MKQRRRLYLRKICKLFIWFCHLMGSAPITWKFHYYRVKLTMLTSNNVLNHTWGIQDSRRFSCTVFEGKSFYINDPWCWFYGSSNLAGQKNFKFWKYFQFTVVAKIVNKLRYTHIYQVLTFCHIIDSIILYIHRTIFADSWE